MAAPAPRPVILVVEDDPQLLKMVATMLGSIATVLTATNGAEALGILRGDPVPNLIITDIMMPQMDGLAFVRHMKADRRLGRIPVIFLTAKDSAKDVVTGINMGARHYLTKPFKQQELLDKVKKALAR